LTHKKHKNSNNDQYRETCDEQLSPNALTLWLIALEIYIMVQHVANESFVDNLGLNSFKLSSVLVFALYRQALDFDRSDLILID